MSPVPRSIICGRTSWTFFITTLTLRFSILSIASVLASTKSPPNKSGIGVQNVELACLLQDLRHQRRAAPRVKQIDDQRNHRVAVLFAECR